MATLGDYARAINLRLPPARSQKVVGKLPARTVYIAVDTQLARPTESGEEVGEVGLALLPRLEELPWTAFGSISPRRFVLDHGVQFYTFRGTRCATGGPTLREGFRDTIAAIHRKLHPDARIAFVGSGSYQDFRRMGLTPQDLFDCLDYQISLVDVTLSDPPSRKEGFEDLTQTFTHEACVESLDERHQGFTRAVWRLGSLHALICPRKLEVARLEVSNDLNASLREPFRTIITAWPFPLPGDISSAHGLAEALLPFRPIHVAAASSRGLSSTHREGMHYGCVCFETEEELVRFTELIHGAEIYGREMIVIRIHPNALIEIGAPRRSNEDYEVPSRRLI
ncbi:hypothetical protein F4805DRAFT_420780 [Annulohypoxylon moriforme]|nr:hypothetical protein F4805DRAFT_420780 [Annulohypoxylon moriforme]